MLICNFSGTCSLYCTFDSPSSTSSFSFLLTISQCQIIRASPCLLHILLPYLLPSFCQYSANLLPVPTQIDAVISLEERYQRRVPYNFDDMMLFVNHKVSVPFLLKEYVQCLQANSLWISQLRNYKSEVGMLSCGRSKNPIPLLLLCNLQRKGEKSTKKISIKFWTLDSGAVGKLHLKDQFWI